MKKVVLIISFLILSAVVVSGALASVTGTTEVSVSIVGGSLSMTAPTVTNDFESLTIGGGVQTTSADLGTASIVDARGTGEGWRLQAQATRFQLVGNPTVQLPEGSLSLKAPTLTANWGGGGSPEIGVGPFILDESSAATIITAEENEGMGNYTVTFPTESLTLTINTAAVQVGAYESTITWNLVTGP